MNLNQISNSKKGFVFSMLVILGSLIMFIYLEATFHNPNYDDIQEFDNTRILRINDEFTFMKNSVVPEIIRYSAFFATQDLLEILATDAAARTNAKGNYSYLQSKMTELMINGTFDGSNRPLMDNKTVEDLMAFYSNFSNETLRVDYTYQIRGTRIYEKTPLFLSIEMELYQRMESYDLELVLEEPLIIDVSFPLNTFKDPQVLLYVNQSSDEILTDAKSRTSYDGEWNWDLLNETYEDGLVTIFTYPEYQYTVGTSFLRSIVNSTQKGKYFNILSFLSFEYEQDSSPYDTKNYDLGHEFYSNTLFLTSLNDVSTRIDESSYNNSFNVPIAGDDCTIQGVNQLGCRLNNLRPIQNLDSSGSNFTFSFWINYTSSGTIIDSDGFMIQTDIATENATVELYTQTLGTRTLSGVRIKSGEWSNIIIQSRDDGFIDVMVNGVSQIQELLEIEDSLIAFDEIEVGGNVLFDEIVFVNSSLSINQIASLLSSRKAIFTEYDESLFGSGLKLTGNERIDLNSSIINGTYTDFAIEYWFYLDDSSVGDLANFQNSTSSNQFVINISNNDLQVIIEDTANQLSLKKSNLNLDDSSYKHLIIQLQGFEIQVFLNSVLIMDGTYNGEFGGYDTMRLFNTSSSLSGLVDEFVLYNRSLSSDEIRSHYYNFKSEVGGCCNYFKMYNPDKHGLINTNFSSSTIFLSNGSKLNLSLTTMGQKNSSMPPTARWYGEQVDNCQIYIYNLQDYVDMSSVKVGAFGNSCQELIERGVY